MTGPTLKLVAITGLAQLSGKASDLDHSWLDHIDHHKAELSACCLVMYVDCNLTGQMWSIRPAFVIRHYACF